MAAAAEGMGGGGGFEMQGPDYEAEKGALVVCGACAVPRPSCWRWAAAREPVCAAAACGGCAPIALPATRATPPARATLQRWSSASQFICYVFLALCTTCVRAYVRVRVWCMWWRVVGCDIRRALHEQRSAVTS